MRALDCRVLVLLLAVGCGGKIAPPDRDLDPTPQSLAEPNANPDAEPEPEPEPEPEQDVVRACERPRAARVGHTCSTSCATTTSPERAFTSPGELLDFMQTRWIACSNDVNGFPANGLAFHDGCNFSWLVDGAEGKGGSFAIASLRARSADIVLHADGLPDERMVVSMSECPNQLRVSRGDQTTYLMAE